MNKPLCFVLMPFGQKTDAAGNSVDFDRVYHEIIEPAIERSGLESIRADEEMKAILADRATSWLGRNQAECERVAYADGHGGYLSWG